jgi:hypothetical protein
MLRHCVTKAVVGRHPAVLSSRRAYASAATSRQKRVLNQQQLEGSIKNSPATSFNAASTAGSTPPSSGAASTSAPSPAVVTSGSGVSPPSGGGAGGGGAGGGTMFGILAAVGAGGALVAYFNGLIPGLGEDDSKEKPKKQKDESTPTVVVADDDPSVSTQESESIDDDKEDKDDSSLNSSNALDKANAGPADAGEVSDEDEVADATTVAAMDESSTTPMKMEEKATPPPPKALLTESKIMDELKRVKQQLIQESDRALTEAHSELAKLSILNWDNLDDMTQTQLKVRLVQLAKEMEDRTKWEAVRLQQFLLMKEKEVEDKYVQLDTMMMMMMMMTGFGTNGFCLVTTVMSCFGLFYLVLFWLP